MNVWQFDQMLLRPVLAALNPLIPNSEAARRLLLGTAAYESQNFQFIDQRTNGPDVDGPAYGMFQMERGTHDDIWDNFLSFRADLAAAIERFHLPGIERVKQMQGNLYYATAMARIQYRRARPALPHANDLDGLAKYYKTWFNSVDGKGTADGFKQAVRRIYPVWFGDAPA